MAVLSPPGARSRPNRYNPATMGDFTPHQRRIIERYYDHRDEIALTSLQEIVSDLMLAESEKRVDQLWARVGKAMRALKVPSAIADHILEKKSPESLARHVREWLDQARRPRR